MATSESTPVHPLVADAARGVLPEWAIAGKERRRHMARVAELLESWARARGEGPEDVARWTAAGNLHDALREENPERLKSRVEPRFLDLPGKALHGPGVAMRLKEEGVADEELLHAIAYHTMGSPGFGTLGLALYAADFLEPGRKLREKWRGNLRKRAPGELEKVVKEILAARIGYLLKKGRPLHPETVAFWNRLSEGQPWANASEF